MKEVITKIKDNIQLFHEVNEVLFDEGKHQYRFNGQICAGISSISEYRPAPWMKPWAAKMVVEYLADKQEDIKNISPAEYAELLQKAKNAYARRSKDAMDIGTRVHDWVEQHIKGADLPITDDIAEPVKQFLAFEAKHNIEWVLVEQIVASATQLVAGRLDALAFVDGEISLVDFKTSKQVDEGHYLQTAGYKMCLEEMGVEVDQRIILRLPKKQGEGFEAVLVDTPYKKDKEAFLNLRWAWQWACMVDAKYKKRVGKFKKLELKHL